MIEAQIMSLTQIFLSSYFPNVPMYLDMAHVKCVTLAAKRKCSIISSTGLMLDNRVYNLKLQNQGISLGDIKARACSKVGGMPK